MASHDDDRSDAGQVLPLMLLVVLVAMGAAVAVGRLGVEVVDRARARTAADAAALAGVAGGRAAAEGVARANGGRVVRLVTDDGATEVTVRVGDEQATSRARAGGPEPAADHAWVVPTGPPDPTIRSGSTAPHTLRSMPPRGAIAQSVRAHP